MLSVIIPSYKDPLLHKTIDSLLGNARGEIEIIVVIDGYKLKQPLRDDSRITQITLEKNVGMREAINTGVAASSGKYIMRTDEHCMFGEGFDIKIIKDIQPNWIVDARRYKLDVEKWEVMLNLAIDHEKLIILKSRNKFASQVWRIRDNDKMIDEKMAMQGSVWFMCHEWWDKIIKRLDSTGYGTHYQDSIEMIFKTWQAGGKLMLNKNTWYAHKHRKFKRTHNYKRNLSDASFKYALEVWGDYYNNVVKPKWGI